MPESERVRAIVALLVKHAGTEYIFTKKIKITASEGQKILRDFPVSMKYQVNKLFKCLLP